ncbi:NitT/TauT family transport system substrate-binding protein [Paenibacillus forsythiae]|uniref:NitT/TauT family transport system substrate-binding protein n=1 Tax=Paenibacillus forsythiae TaxID=365616 RepID=A0ABU3H3G6_9BACL|nr:NitT/TauT family transport system substrate-binding protein [Paenibacillus forsythiae]
MRRVAAILLAVTMAWSVSGCARGGEATSGGASASPSGAAAGSETSKEQVTIRFANLAVGLESAYHQLGIEHGIFSKYGIDLQVVNFTKGGAEATAGVVSGQVDMGSYGTPILTGIAKGVDMKIVASPPIKESPFYLVAKKGITSVQELKGKTVATGAFGGGNHQSFVKILEKNGMKESEVNVVATGGTDEYMILQSGKADAIETVEPVVSRLVADNIGTLLVKAADVYGDYQHFYVFATGDFIKEHPEAVRNFLKASRESHEYARDHFEELVAKGKTLVNMDEKIIREFYKNNIAQWDLSFKVNVTGTENAVKIIQGLGEIDKNVVFDPNTWIDSSFLE